MSAATALSHPNSNVHAGQISNGVRPSTNGAGDRQFAHIKDLQAAAESGYDRNSSIAKLLQDAERGLNQAKTMNDFRRPDMAFVEYLRASTIVMEVIPRHRDRVDFDISHPEGKQKLNVLLKRVHAMNEQYTNIKVIIVHNNQRHGTLPLGYAKAGSTSQTQSQGERRMDNGQQTNTRHSIPPRVRPVPSPKPDNLHGRALSLANPGTNGTSDFDALTDRFAKLSNSQIDTIGTSNLGASRLDTRISDVLPPVLEPVPEHSNGRPSFDRLSSTNSIHARLHGPRGMPDNGPSAPSRLNTDFVLPQEPKATYSPARNMQTTGNIALPRHSARSLASNPVRRSSMVVSSSASSTAPNGSSSSSDYFPVTAAKVATSDKVQRRQGMIIPTETRIQAKMLYDYLERYNILLIDLRSRQEYDEGHVFARNVLCIEPISITQGMSADELLESMVVSPDVEQEMFFNRDKYDLVIYYDNNTSSATYLERPSNDAETKLKFLHESLFDFNQEKPLHRPPILLIGGIEAWVDLIGHQALVTSNTAAQVKQGRPLQRRPLATAVANGNSQLRIPKRRMRDYNPLDPEEEKSWRERARAESVVLPMTLPEPIVDDGSDTDVRPTFDGDDETGTAIRDFNARFPEAGSLDRHAFASVQPTRAPPEVPAKVPLYPTAPPVSHYPVVPVRPPPAAARVSYMGVSDRAVSASSLNSRTASGAPYIPPKYLAANFRLPRVGLTNFGNTCYMNSTIQALLATTPLSSYFLEDDFKASLQRENWRANSKGVMAELYSNLIRSLWKDDVSYIRPTTFRKFCGRSLQRFESDGEQQDAKDFLDFLLDCLHEDLNENWDKAPLRQLTDAEEANRERMPKLYVAKTEWGRYIHRDFSFINKLLGGQHLSKLTCTTCGFTSSKYEAFTSISVEIPTDVPKFGNGRFPTLQDCLKSYCTEELLNKDEMWNCPHCKTQREATKRITITRVPQFLIIHFKRFASFGSSARKVRTPVDFPLENLDLGPYTLPQPGPEDLKLIAARYGPDILKYDESMTPPYLYDAYAVVRHIGQTMQSGHYITAAKDRARKQWRWFNDTRVSDFNPSDLRGSQSLQNEEAYIVFYERKVER
nr:ubiquitin carboxyl-terminal hydrolase 4 [Quercus suber]